ncbi:MAG: DUF4406 domain-containing protein [Lachnospiraceae bacterium]|nr:DUF4406 domain-containing protein [Lachnospiraceae bacterium]
MERKLRVYISGAITGTDDYRERFARAEAFLMGQGCSVINPAKIDAALPADMTYEEHMKIDMMLLESCDAVYMLKGWQESRGANREYGYALGVDKDIVME